MLLLALDTSTRQASVALCSEDALHGEHTWHVANNHSVELLGHIQALCAQSQLTLQQIDAVAVATGPGSFNGVRVALATAKALAFALKKPLLGVSTLDIIAAQQQQWPGPVCAVLEAGRSELYAACYVGEKLRRENDIAYNMKRLSEYLLQTPQDLATYLLQQAQAWTGIVDEGEVPAFLFCGEISLLSRQALSTSMQGHGLFVGNLEATRSASTLAMLAMQRLNEGQEDDPLLLEPLYLRRPSITTSKRKQPLLGTAATGQSQTEREEGALRH
ncbi:tRNA (adenosine(37)-N6)-threonylcarbamoyltransferase complex dimerization subunit type 1 TsaB [Ktedonosporobacter rubrisoli]|uniref:tRNA (Adenosine(37)-N6)-threonylcarbamoyltransferase complex dimerization subunit type 1 TsaB n=1 Tax=Ktedonosporobacter rubrisoli TaxID=2509675 RepID=A0A4P6K312_KTERU|nr:tRNA (adenosine(37)-N6)-threonylcarbamoyltransferase complex dimerization subunit type 1 TsaB [Ktedonosporobacter rubrisoli]QBD82120.1 tRNA (adenosine(37)-N6)-threonylcarbamoyltransferase complex dimerization subunit type 1 TsaB [Ktedonosporobacter rubrisoli]